MKKISSIFYFLLFLFSLLNLSSSKANAQTYYFMNDSATWKIDWFGYDGFCAGHCFEWEYYISGDTIINSHSFKKLREKYHNISYQYYLDENAGAIREDTINKKVYYVPLFQNDTVQYLLYDFNLNVGDTIPPLYCNQNGTFQVVDSIDFVMIGNENHKRFWITNDCWSTIYLIEGVGSYNGLKEPIECPFEQWTYLTCFKVGNEVLFNAIDTSSYGCDVSIPLSIESPVNYSSIQIINNINDNVLTIENSTGEKLSIKLFDELGREHLHQSSSSTKFQFSTQSLAAGIYFVECADENGMTLLSQKILVK